MMNSKDIRLLLEQARKSRKYADELERQAQRECCHFDEDGKWTIASGLGVGVGEDDCTVCGLSGCYIKKYVDQQIIKDGFYGNYYPGTSKKKKK